MGTDCITKDAITDARSGNNGNYDDDRDGDIIDDDITAGGGSDFFCNFIFNM